MADEFPEGAAEMVQRYIDDNHGFLSWLGTTVDAIEDGRVTLTVPYDEKLLNAPIRNEGSSTGPTPQMHGGVAATLADTAGGLALRTRMPNPTSDGVATVNLNVNYLRQASADLTATAEVIRCGNTIGVSEITVESDTPTGTEAVATGQAAYRLFRNG